MGKVVGLDFEITRQFGANAALVHNELQFWSNKKSSRKDGWIYKTYEEMTDRLPLSEQTIRRAYKKLEAAGLISTKIMRLDGTPVLHYKLAESETTNLAESKETTKMADSINTVTNTVTSHDSDLKDSSVSVGAEFGAVDVPADERRRLLEYVISVINPREKPTADRVRLINARLKDYSPREIALTAQVLAQSEWHRDNKQMSVDNLLAPSKFGKLYAKVDDTALASSAPIQTEVEKRESDMERIRKANAEQEKRNQEFIDQGL